MDRRSLLKSLAAAGAIALLPDDAALAAWKRAGSRRGNGLSDAQLARIGAIADVILPRTDTPSATDVGVPAFVDVIVSENYAETDRASFVANLDAIDPAALDAIEAADRRVEPQRTYWRLKGLVIHGYFTSERVMKDVLHYKVMPGRYDGAAPMPSVHRG